MRVAEMYQINRSGLLLAVTFSIRLQRSRSLQSISTVPLMRRFLPNTVLRSLICDSFGLMRSAKAGTTLKAGFLRTAVNLTGFTKGIDEAYCEFESSGHTD